MRVAVFAYHDVGYECLKVLIEMKEEIVAVVTHEDDPREEVWFRSVAELATANELPAYAPRNPNSPQFVSLIRSLSPEIIFSFYYRRLLSKQLLDIAPVGGINLHGSLLPKYRGRAPVNWAILNGETETGVTLHYMVEEADAGDIIAQAPVPIAEHGTALDLHRKITRAGARLLRQTLPLITEGRAPRIRQDERLASKFGARRPEDGKIRWDLPARRVYNLIRAVTHPYPGAFTFWGGRKLFVWEAAHGGEWSQGTPARKLGRWEARKPGDQAPWPASLRASRPPSMLAEGLPGTVVAVEEGKGIWVRTGNDLLLITKAQLAGEEEVAADEMAARHGIRAGSRLGE